MQRDYSLSISELLIVFLAVLLIGGAAFLAMAVAVHFRERARPRRRSECLVGQNQLQGEHTSGVATKISKGRYFRVAMSVFLFVSAIFFLIMGAGRNDLTEFFLSFLLFFIVYREVKYMSQN